MKVLFCSAYDQMGMPPTIFKLANTPLYGFVGHSIQPYREVELLMTAGSHPTQPIVLTNFLIVDSPRVDNVIIRRPTLNALWTIASMYHLVLKFSMSAVVGVFYGNQVEACYYYALALKGPSSTHQEVNIIDNSSSTNSLDIWNLRSSLPGDFTPSNSLSLEALVTVKPTLALVRADSVEQHGQLGRAPQRQQRAQAESSPDREQSKCQRGLKEFHDTPMSEKERVDA